MGVGTTGHDDGTKMMIIFILWVQPRSRCAQDFRFCSKFQLGLRQSFLSVSGRLMYMYRRVVSICSGCYRCKLQIKPSLLATLSPPLQEKKYFRRIDNLRTRWWQHIQGNHQITIGKKQLSVYHGRVHRGAKR